MSEKHDAMIEKVRALLAKAESSDFPEEARALAEKAQELMTIYSIEESMLQTPEERNDHITSDMLVIDAPYAQAKVTLCNVIAKANSCSAIQLGDAKRRYMDVHGADSDIQNVRTLFYSLLVQAVNEQLKAVPPRGTSTRAFRNAFIYGYAAAIKERLSAGVRAASIQHDQETQGTSSALVLADKNKLARRSLQDKYPNMRTKRSTYQSASGAAAGNAAGHRADLGGNKVGAGTRGALNA